MLELELLLSVLLLSRAGAALPSLPSVETPSVCRLLAVRGRTRFVVLADLLSWLVLVVDVADRLDAADAGRAPCWLLGRGSVAFALAAGALLPS